MDERRYTKNGEWVAFDGQQYKVGLSASAVDDLGDVTFVELPALGTVVAAGESLCVIEAVKAASDYYSPLDGRISAVNNRLGTEPELINSSPEQDGWIAILDSVSAESFTALLDEAAWKEWEAGR